MALSILAATNAFSSRLLSLLSILRCIGTNSFLEWRRKQLISSHNVLYALCLCGETYILYNVSILVENSCIRKQTMQDNSTTKGKLDPSPRAQVNSTTKRRQTWYKPNCSGNTELYQCICWVIMIDNEVYRLKSSTSTIRDQLHHELLNLRLNFTST